MVPSSLHELTKRWPGHAPRSYAFPVAVEACRLIVERPNFLTPDECARALAIYRCCGATANGSLLRDIRPMTMKLHGWTAAAEWLEALNDRIAATVCETFGVSAVENLTRTLTVLNVGENMCKHADNCMFLGDGGDNAMLRVRWSESDGVAGHWTPNHTPRNALSSVLYLNNDFEGGELVFEQHARSVRPATGLLVMFPANRYFIHEVEYVRRGQRFSFASWYGNPVDESASGAP